MAASNYVKNNPFSVTHLQWRLWNDVSAWHDWRMNRQGMNAWDNNDFWLFQSGHFIWGMFNWGLNGQRVVDLDGQRMLKRGVIIGIEVVRDLQLVSDPFSHAHICSGWMEHTCLGHDSYSTK